jgi:hypothetical protein
MQGNVGRILEYFRARKVVLLKLFANATIYLGKCIL